MAHSYIMIECTEQWSFLGLENPLPLWRIKSGSTISKTKKRHGHRACRDAALFICSTLI
jgi:hypothetical protein